MNFIILSSTDFHCMPHLVIALKKTCANEPEHNFLGFTRCSWKITICFPHGDPLVDFPSTHPWSQFRLARCGGRSYLLHEFIKEGQQNLQGMGATQPLLDSSLIGHPNLWPLDAMMSFKRIGFGGSCAISHLLRKLQVAPLIKHWKTDN